MTPGFDREGAWLAFASGASAPSRMTRFRPLRFAVQRQESARSMIEAAEASGR
jgi:hypothetical protein